MARHPDRRHRQWSDQRRARQRHRPPGRWQRHVRLGPGDGSDSVEGQGGHDALQFNGSNVAVGQLITPIIDLGTDQ
jgi:hypothetical protein